MTKSPNLKKAGQYELAHFLIGQYATSGITYAPNGIELAILSDGHLGHELLEIKDAETRMTEVVPLTEVDSTWLYYRMAYRDIKSEDREGREWGVPHKNETIDKEELKDILHSLSHGNGSLEPVWLPAVPTINGKETGYEILSKTVDYFLSNKKSRS